MCLVFGSSGPLGHLGSLPRGPFASIRPDCLPSLMVLEQHSKRVKVDVARSLEAQAIEITQCHFYRIYWSKHVSGWPEFKG